MPNVEFRNGKLKPFAKFTFNNIHTAKNFRYKINELYPPPSQTDIDNGNWKRFNWYILADAAMTPATAFMNRYDLCPHRWISIDKRHLDDIEDGPDSFARYEYEIELPVFLKPNYDNHTIAPRVVNSEDIETGQIHSLYRFSNPEEPDDWILSIAHTIFTTTTLDVIRVVFTWGNQYQIPELDVKTGKPLEKKNITIFNFKNESEMLVEWCRWLYSPYASFDVTVGWNYLGFDQKYIWKRIEFLKKKMDIPNHCFQWGRIRDEDSVAKIKLIYSKTMNNEVQLVSAPGRIVVDGLIVSQRDGALKLHNYHLDAVGYHYFEEGKVGLHFTEITKFFLGTPEEKGYMLYYNVQDCDLTMKIWNHVNMWFKSVNECRTMRINMNDICTKGLQNKSYCGLSYMAKTKGYVMWKPHYHPILDDVFEEDEFTIERDRFGEEIIKIKESKLSQMDCLFDVVGDSMFSKNQKSTIKKNEYHTRFEMSDMIKVFNEHPKPPNMRLKKKYEEITRIVLEQRQKGKSKEEKVGKGGMVMIPIPQMTELAICLDWTSLYPSCMISFNLCHSTLVLEPEFANCEGVTYSEFRIGSLSFRFAFNKDGTLTEFLKQLLYERALSKNAMKMTSKKLELFDEFVNQMKNDFLKMNDMERFILEKKDGRKIKEEKKKICSKWFKDNKDTFTQFFNNVSVDNLIPIWKKIFIGIQDDINNIAKNELVKEKIHEWNKEITNCFETFDLDCEMIKNQISTLKKYFISEVKPLLAMGTKTIAFEIELLIDRLIQFENTIPFFKSLHHHFVSQTAFWDGAQNSQKLGSNSTYGGTLAGGRSKIATEGSIKGRLQSKGMMQCIPVGLCTTGIGRNVNNECKNTLENTPEMYFDTEVVYADTDSLFIDFDDRCFIAPNKTFEEKFTDGFRLGKEVAERLTAMFKSERSVMSLAFEKLITPLAMYKSKCYSGRKYLSPNDDPEPFHKGLKTIKRDTCDMIRNIVKEHLDDVIENGTFIDGKFDFQESIDKLKKMLEVFQTPEKLELKKLIEYQKLGKPNYGTQTQPV